MSWKAEYLILILITTIVSFTAAISMSNTKKKALKRSYLIGSIVINLGILFFFKYFNFVSENIYRLFSQLGINATEVKLNYLLPVGISFYTFQTLSYSIDVYKGKKDVETHFGVYALYVSFFPQLVAGPIERSTSLLPQFKGNPDISIDKIILGIKYIIFGFFLKLVVADRIALYVDSVYNNVLNHDGISFLVATILFSFQIYGDFAGYSFIAIGIAKLMGYDLMINFRRPYFAKTITEFWHRWHISLSSWFRDYVYIPLGGSRVSNKRWILNIIITFIISGLWHGAAWTFLTWGAIHGIIIVLEKQTNLHKVSSNSTLLNYIRIIGVFCITSFSWIFFRANSTQDAMLIVKDIFLNPGYLFTDYVTFFYTAIAILILFVHDYYEEFISEKGILSTSTSIRSAIYFGILGSITLYQGVFNGGQFIYFQF